MLRPQKYNIEDTNIANLGTELEKKVKRAAAETEEQWKGVGKEPGIRIWRIEKFKVVPWPQDKYGSFYSGDSYIILRTYKKSEDSEALAYDVHFWLGQETSQDEAGTAAYKTVELDDVLGGAPVQHREVQGFESQLFLSYFPKLQLLAGGVDSGFRHVEQQQYRARLLQIKGIKENTIIRELPLKVESLNSGDVFILDSGQTIFQFNGSKSNLSEKVKAAEFAQALSGERPQAQLNTFEEGTESPEFWKILGGKAPILSEDKGGDDKQVESVKVLFRLTDGVAKGVSQINLNPAPVPPHSKDSKIPILTPASPFDPAKDAEEIKNAMGFFGNKHSVWINILGARTYQQRLKIAEAFQKLTNEDLVKKLESKTSFNFKKTLMALFTPPYNFDAACLKAATKGLGTDEGCLIEILANRTNADLQEIKKIYKSEYQTDLEADIADDTSGDFRKFLLEVLKCERDESDKVDEELAKKDASDLYQAGEARWWGTDEKVFVSIITKRNHHHLLRVFEHYKDFSKYSILESIHRETHGDFRQALLAFVQSIISKPEFYQERLYKAMRGLGTNDETLIRIITSRCEIDLGSIKQAFDNCREETLSYMIAGDTSGHYQDILLKLLNEPKPVYRAPDVKTVGGGGSNQPKLTISAVASGKIPRDLLDSNDVFIFDTGFEVFAWVGKGASRAEKKTALQFAQDYLIAYKKPLQTPISRILEGGENEVFEACFDPK